MICHHLQICLLRLSAAVPLSPFPPRQPVQVLPGRLKHRVGFRVGPGYRRELGPHFANRNENKTKKIDTLATSRRGGG